MKSNKCGCGYWEDERNKSDEEERMTSGLVVRKDQTNPESQSEKICCYSIWSAHKLTDQLATSNHLAVAATSLECESPPTPRLFGWEVVKCIFFLSMVPPSSWRLLD
jgi:hypothetical protein